MGSGARGIPRVGITMQVVEEKKRAIVAASLLFLPTTYYSTRRTKGAETKAAL
ncbi:MAG TPA: hypothetical protein VH540_05230 [Ktedonobacterales bacterium]|jgi:hypothetical protein